MANMDKESIVAGALEKGGVGKSKGTGKSAKAEKPMVHHMSVHRVHGGHVVHHYHKPHEEGDTAVKPDATHVVPNGPGGEGDIDPLHAHMEEHMGAPNSGEEPEDGATEAVNSTGGPGAPAPTGGANLGAALPAAA
jgi:hypothetical protein